MYEEGESDPTNTQEVLLTSMDELESENINIFPNPADNFILINANESISLIELYNNKGQLLSKNKTNGKSFEFDISEFEAGIYFLRIETKNNTFSKQIIKK